MTNGAQKRTRQAALKLSQGAVIILFYAKKLPSFCLVVALLTIASKAMLSAMNNPVEE